MITDCHIHIQPLELFNARALALILSVLMVAQPTLWAAKAGPELPNPGNVGMSRQQQEQLGLQAAGEVYKQMPVLPDNSPVTQYVQALGRKLVRVIPQQYTWPYQFHVIQQKEINAFALPGGPIFINIGTITGSHASGAVTGDDGSFVGGLVGFNLLGTIENSYSVSKVTVGADGAAGGLTAVNFGTISRSFATGAVTGGDNSYVGGLVAWNFGDPTTPGTPFGVISQSYATGAVTGGANSVVGGLVAENAGSIDQAGFLSCWGSHFRFFARRWGRVLRVRRCFLADEAPFSGVVRWVGRASWTNGCPRCSSTGSLIYLPVMPGFMGASRNGNRRLSVAISSNRSAPVLLSRIKNSPAKMKIRPA